MSIEYFVIAQDLFSRKHPLHFLVINYRRLFSVILEPYAFDQNISSLYERALWLNLNFNLNQYMNNPKAAQQIHATKEINQIVSKHSNTLLLTRNDLFRSDQMATLNTPYSLDGRHMSIVGSLASEEYFEQQPKFSVLEKFIAEDK